MQSRAGIYLDSNAGAPLRPEVARALLSLLERGPGLLPNPSSIHSHGRKAKRLLAEARESIAGSLGQGIDPEQLVFVSSGTEANQLAVRSVLEPRLLRGEKPHWILTAAEHDSNLQLLRWLERRGGSATLLPVDDEGRPRLSALEELWRPETALLSAVWVNNETGVISDARELCAAARRLGGLVHLDAAQAWGKIPIDLSEVGAHFVSFSAHKIGGLAGSGVLWAARGAPLEAVIAGKQEKGRRGGTENLVGIVAMGVAASCLEPEAWDARVRPCRERLESEVLGLIPGALVNGAGAPRAANTSSLSFDGVVGDGLIMALDLAGYSVSSGSACSSGVLEPSHVLLAMGRSKAQAMAACRISLADGIPWETLEGFVKALELAVRRVRKGSADHVQSSVIQSA